MASGTADGRFTGVKRLEGEEPHSVIEERLKKFVSKADVGPLKAAVFNIGLLLFAGLCLLGCFAVYRLMYAFLKPMMWAILVGTVIFPFKKKVTDVIRGWLRSLRDSGTPLVLGMVFLPLQWLDHIANCIWATVASKDILFIVGGYVILKITTYEGAFIACVRLAATLYGYLSSVILIFSSNWVRKAMISLKKYVYGEGGGYIQGFRVF